MSLGGFVWIQNLTEVDHSYILPVTLGLINLAILEVIRNSLISVNSVILLLFTSSFFLDSSYE